jgi:ADP-heptose:LPS heptosyltransferase
LRTSGLPHTLVVRLDAMGDMVICGPAIRAIAAGSRRTTVLCGAQGNAAARLLPGVDEVITFDCPWISPHPHPVDRVAIDAVIDRLSGKSIDAAVILTSFHQSALPTALLLRWAGIQTIAAISEDYPGSLLDTRIAPPPEAPEPCRMLAVAEAAGYALPALDDGRLRLHDSALPSASPLEPPYVVLHPGAAAPARRYPPDRWREVVELLARDGERIVLTGDASEAPLTAAIAAAGRRASVIDLAGSLDLPALAALLRGADVLVAGNTGPAHLAAAVGTPVVSLFSPVVSAERWAPFGPDVVVLGDQRARCRDTRARECPIPGHPCLSGVAVAKVVAALERVRRHAPQPDAAVVVG